MIWILEVASAELSYASKLLKEIPKEVFENENLKILDLSFNKITALLEKIVYL
eukprot:jgi/Antlo1/570/2263